MHSSVIACVLLPPFAGAALSLLIGSISLPNAGFAVMDAYSSVAETVSVCGLYFLCFARKVCHTDRSKAGRQYLCVFEQSMASRSVST
jgi:hypothetical protein